MIEEIERWRPLLEKQLSSLRGVSIEDKVFSIAVHYRQSREKKKARAAIVEAAAALNNARVIGGTLVVNILPKGAPHKGMALERERERLGCDTAIYVGDDETDEDVFALQQPVAPSHHPCRGKPAVCRLLLPAGPGRRRRAAAGPRPRTAKIRAAHQAVLTNAFGSVHCPRS